VSPRRFACLALGAALVVACEVADSGEPATSSAADAARSPDAAAPDAAAGGSVASPDAAAVATPDAAAGGTTVPDAAPIAPPDAAPIAPDMGPLPGGERPSRFWIPSAPPPEAGYPLVLLLHGYMAGSILIDRQFGFSQRVEADGFALLVPDGLQDADGAQRWNTERPAEGSTDPDDIQYLSDLVNETMDRYPIDRSRVYVVGHSNGGYMAFRLGCDLPDLFTGIVPASALYRIDPATCVQGPPVNVLHVHGDRDGAHPFEGTENELGVNALVEMWAGRNHCPMGTPPVDSEHFDAELTTPGPETSAYVYRDCDAGTIAGRWRMENVGHVFIVTPEGTQRLLAEILGMHR
jgi:polyhydroxybutyrate depolymerase